MEIQGLYFIFWFFFFHSLSVILWLDFHATFTESGPEKIQMMSFTIGSKTLLRKMAIKLLDLPGHRLRYR